LFLYLGVKLALGIERISEQDVKKKHLHVRKD